MKYQTVLQQAASHVWDAIRNHEPDCIIVCDVPEFKERLFVDLRNIYKDYTITIVDKFSKTEKIKPKIQQSKKMSAPEDLDDYELDDEIDELDSQRTVLLLKAELTVDEQFYLENLNSRMEELLEEVARRK